MKMNIKFIAIASGVLLLLGIPNNLWPYSYYILLRWIIFITSGIVAWGFYQSKLMGWALAFGATAILFNPLVPIYLSKSSWVAIDFVTAIIFFLAAYSYKKSSLKRAK